MKSKFAPIIIITLCRDEHFVRCVESLKTNTWAKYTDVYIGLDFPPSEKYHEGWKKINEYLNVGDFFEFKSFNIIRQKENIGAFRNYEYMRELLSKSYDRYIYAEDDLKFASTFLEYINKTMWKYEDDKDVLGVTGYCYPVNWQYSSGATCIKQNFNVAMWGTAFWFDKHNKLRDYIHSGMHYELLPKVMFQKLYENMIDFSQREYFPKALKYYPGINPEGMLMATVDAAMRLYTAIEGKYMIMPTISKVRNYGFDGSGLYCGTSNVFEKQIIDESTSYECIPNELDNIRENKNKLNAYEGISRKDKYIIIVCKALISILGVNTSRKLVHLFVK